jgi:hypothetical protein
MPCQKDAVKHIPKAHTNDIAASISPKFLAFSGG